MTNILITGGRSPAALELARQLHAAGHTISVADTSHLHVCRFSNAVSKTFSIPSPRFQTRQFIESIKTIIDQHQIELVIPIYEEILYLSKALNQFPKQCRIFCTSFDALHQLHNKWSFYQKLLTYGFAAPRTQLIQTDEELQRLDLPGTYALKACYSRASQSVIKMEPGQQLPKLKIQQHNPWIAQEWLSGKKYCSYSVCHEGVVKAHAVYPVNYAIENNSCLTFQAIDHPGILEWTERFVREDNFTGQIAFDFIEPPGGPIYAIECNPRATSGVHLFKPEDRLDRAFFNQTEKPIYPKIGNAKQIATGMMLYGWRNLPGVQNKMHFLKHFLRTQDVVLDRRDLKPFVAQSLILPYYVLKSYSLKLPFPAMFTFDVDWNGDS